MGGSGGEGVGQAAETESTLALAENVYVNLPRPSFPRLLFDIKSFGIISMLSLITINFSDSHCCFTQRLLTIDPVFLTRLHLVNASKLQE